MAGIATAEILGFATALLSWYETSKRPLPWRNTSDAYVIWLSEIILQQTRVAQGLPYFNRFLQAFPTLAQFAAASEQQVLALWQGLGYYSRGRNMLVAARQVMENYEGQFPADYNRLLKIKGIGPYTAAAIASFAFNLPYAVVDGNVYRVLSRFFGITTPVNTTAGASEFATLAQSLLPRADAGTYNQAIMELGALVCTPKSPACGKCPVNVRCVAFNTGNVAGLPVKLKPRARTVLHLHYFVCIAGQAVYLRHRSGPGIWQGMYDLPAVEGEKLTAGALETLFKAGAKPTHLLAMQHVLTHRELIIKFYNMPPGALLHPGQFTLAPLSELQQYPLPRPVHLALQRMQAPPLPL